MKNVRRLFAVGGVFLMATSWVYAQPSNLALQVANMREDFRLLDERTRLQQAQIDELRRENARLLEQLKAAQDQSDAQLSSLATVAQLNQAIEGAAATLRQQDQVVKSEVILEFTKRIEAFAKRVEKIIGVMPSGGGNSGHKTVFHTNFPQSGTSYVVKSGDTLSKIASDHRSSVDWIQNANKVVDPSVLQVGQRLFIPQEK